MLLLFHRAVHELYCAEINVCNVFQLLESNSCFPHDSLTVVQERKWGAGTGICSNQRCTSRRTVLQSCEFFCDLRLFLTFRHSAAIVQCIRKVAHFADRTVPCSRKVPKVIATTCTNMVTTKDVLCALRTLRKVRKVWQSAQL